MTRDELARFNGQNGEKAYIAYQGHVYDVSDSLMWPNGKHLGHYAGRDLTDELPDSPHGEKVFSRVPKIDTLDD